MHLDLHDFAGKHLREPAFARAELQRLGVLKADAENDREVAREVLRPPGTNVREENPALAEDDERSRLRTDVNERGAARFFGFREHCLRGRPGVRLVVDEFEPHALNGMLQIIGVRSRAVERMHVGLELLPHGLVGHKVAAAVPLRNQFEKALALHVAKRGLPGIEFGLLDILACDFAPAQHRLPRAVGAFQRMAADRRPDARNLDASREARFPDGLTDRPHVTSTTQPFRMPDDGVLPMPITRSISGSSPGRATRQSTLSEPTSRAAKNSLFSFCCFMAHF